MVAFLLLVACGGEPPTEPPPPPSPMKSATRSFAKGDARIVLLTTKDTVRADIAHGACTLHLRTGEDGHYRTLESEHGTAKLHLVDDRLDVQDAGLCGEGVDLSGTYEEQ